MGVSDFVRHLARQRLPACELAQIDQALGAFLQPAGHVVERLNGAADFVVALLFHAGVEIAGGQLGKARRQLLDGPAGAVGQID